MKLIRCKTPTDRMCPCGKVARELDSHGLAFEIERVPLSSKPAKRQHVMAMTGQPKVPVLVKDDGTAIHDSRRIVAHIRSSYSRRSA